MVERGFLGFLMWGMNPRTPIKMAFDLYARDASWGAEFWSCMVTMLSLGTAGLIGASLTCRASGRKPRTYA